MHFQHILKGLGITVAVSATLGLLAAGPARAIESAPPQAVVLNADLEFEFQRLDQDNDQHLTVFEARLEPRLSRHFQQLDRDANATLDRLEFAGGTRETGLPLVVAD